MDAQKLFNCSNNIDKYECKICPNFQTNFLSTLRTHLKNGHKNCGSEEVIYKCLKCFFATHSNYLIERHSLLSECNEDEGGTPFACYKYRKIKDISCQNELKSGRFPRKSKRENPPIDTEAIIWLHCGDCPFKTKRQGILSRHRAGHGHSKSKIIEEFECEVCLSKFTRKDNLTQHIKLSHSKPKDIQWFKCKQCPSKFKRKGHLTRHTTSFHIKAEDVKWFPCDHCPSKFKRNGELKTHITSCHSKPDEIQWFKCDQCPSKFKRRGHLRTHVTNCHDEFEDSQLLPCDQCELKFKLKQHLKCHLAARHAKVEDVQWLTCDQCTAKFKTKGHLNRHTSTFHAESQDTQEFESDE